VREQVPVGKQLLIRDARVKPLFRRTEVSYGPPGENHTQTWPASGEAAMNGVLLDRVRHRVLIATATLFI
jgi:hypothetical protein